MPTAQEEFWRGSFGFEYTDRCRVDWQTRVPFWRDIIHDFRPRSVLEVGCNAGWNLHAIRSIATDIALAGVDVNQAAREEAAQAGFEVHDTPASLVGNRWPNQFDLVFTAGVLIHVAPGDIADVMDSIIAASRRWVLAIEYAANEEEEVAYRGHWERLWRRPFGAMYADMGLVPIESGLLSNDDGFDRCGYWMLEKSA